MEGSIVAERPVDIEEIFGAGEAGLMLLGLLAQIPHELMTVTEYEPGDDGIVRDRARVYFPEGSGFVLWDDFHVYHEVSGESVPEAVQALVALMRKKGYTVEFRSPVGEKVVFEERNGEFREPFKTPPYKSSYIPTLP
jgi:hypothetical protein